MLQRLIMLSLDMAAYRLVSRERTTAFMKTQSITQRKQLWKQTFQSNRDLHTWSWVKAKKLRRMYKLRFQIKIYWQNRRRKNQSFSSVTLISGECSWAICHDEFMNREILKVLSVLFLINIFICMMDYKETQKIVVKKAFSAFSVLKPLKIFACDLLNNSDGKLLFL